MSQLTKKISFRIACYLERAKLIVRDAENCCLADDVLGDNEMTTHQGHSIQYRIAVGPHAGEKVFTLKTLPVPDELQNNGICQNWLLFKKTVWFTVQVKQPTAIFFDNHAF